MVRTRLVVLLSVAAVAVAGCGSSGSSKTTTAASAGSLSDLQAPGKADVVRQAPPLTLKNADGRTVSLAQYRGKAVLVTFIYTHCPDVCPLMVGNLHNALDQLGAQARHAQVIAVSVDPRGDTPANVRKFVAAHDMTGRMQYLIGTEAQLKPVWKAWGVEVQGTPDQRESSGLVGHSAAVYGVTGSGDVAGIYPANFKPAWVAHDVPILASH